MFAFVLHSYSQTIQDFKVTFAPLVPPLVVFIAKHPMVANYDLSSINKIFCGAAPLDAELQSACEERLRGVELRQGCEYQRRSSCWAHRGSRLAVALGTRLEGRRHEPG